MQKIKRYEDAMLRDLEALIAIDSVRGEASADAPFGAKPKQALHLFLEQAKRLGFETVNLDDYCGYAEFGPAGAPLVAAICHLDVVPAPGWPEAFRMRLEDGKIIGRGAMDDKGPMISVLYAMKALLDEGYEPPCRIRVIAGTNEESGSACMRHYIAHDEAPVAAFTADADFPVIHAEKGMLGLTLTWDAARDPASDGLVVTCKTGSVGNVIPGEAAYSIRFPDGHEAQFELEGRMGHASTPMHAENALAKALVDCKARIDAAGLAHPFVDAFDEFIGMDFHGERAGADFSDVDSGKLTFSANILELDETHAKLYVDIRFPVTLTSETVIESIRKRFEGSPLRVEFGTPVEPLYFAKDDPLVRTLTEVFGRYYGETLDPIAIGGGTYAKSVPNCVAFGPSFPGEEGNCHQKNEAFRLESFLKSCAIYREALRELAERFAEA